MILNLREQISSLEESIENDRIELAEMARLREEKNTEIENFRTKVAEANVC